MNKALRISRIGVAVMAMAMVSAEAVVTIAIDDFHDLLPPGGPRGNLVVSSGSPMASATTTLTAPSLAGTVRTISLEFGSGGGEAIASTLVAPGRLSFSADTGFGSFPPVTAVMEANYNFAAPVDFTLAGGDGIGVDIFSRDTAVDANITVKVTSSGGGMAMSTAPFTLGGTVQTFDFTSFPGIDFTQVESLSVKITPQPAFDGAIRLLGVTSSSGVPEPSGSMALLALLAGVVARRKR